jgi:hypothetical protein
MTNTYSITVLALGVAVHITLTGSRASEALHAVSHRWGHTTTTTAPVRHLRLELAEPGSDSPPPALSAPAIRHFTSLERLLDTLSSLVTREAIDERNRDLLLLHASGLANPQTGLTVASVAASGTGKTTLSRHAAGTLHYVTDETVGVTAEGTVIAHPKPLSIKNTHSTIKDQRAPMDVGLLTAPAQGLRLARIVLLERSASVTETHLTPVDTIDAILAMLPEISYFSYLHKPLQRLATTITATGGVLRITYAEARDVIPQLQRLTLTPPAPFEPEDAQTREALVRWEAVRSAAGPGRGQLPHATLLSTPLDDILVDEVGGRALIIAGQQVLVISIIAAFLLTAAVTPIAQSVLRQAATNFFGSPSTKPGVQHPFDAMVSQLTKMGLLTLLESESPPA